MISRDRLISLLPYVILLAAVFFLAAGISQLEFRPGVPFSLERTPGYSSSEQGSSLMNGIVFFGRVFLGISALLFPIALIYVIFNRKARRYLLRMLLLTAPLILAMFVMARCSRPLNIQQAAPGGGQDSSLPQMPAPPLARFEAQPDGWAGPAAAILLALALTAVTARWLSMRRPVEERIGALALLAGEAEEAVQALYAGGDLRETVIRCYLEMSRILMREQGIQREETMTAREFELSLHRNGLPEEPLRQLTRLFERARYSPAELDTGEEQRALESLTAIAEACRRRA